MIYFDNIIFSLQKMGGISVVWYELLSRFIKKPPFDYFCLSYSNEKNFYTEDLNIPILKRIIYSSRLLFLKRYCDVRCRESRNFIFHSSYYRICNSENAINITTVHDFTYEYYISGYKKWIHSWQKIRAIEKSDYIICISENTKKDLIKFCPKIEQSKIRVIYNGVSDDYFPLQLDTYDLNDDKKNNFVLFVGSRVSYKNFRLVVSSIVDTPYSLVIVGKPLNKEEADFVYSNLPYNKVLVYSNIDNKQLNILYNKAFCLLYPSSYEGFGIPVLEAQRAGCPVIAYNASSIPEIIGDKTLLLQNLDEKSIHYLFSILECEEKRKKIIELGLLNSSKYTWDNMYNKLLDLYREALDNRISK